MKKILKAAVAVITAAVLTLSAGAATLPAAKLTAKAENDSKITLTWSKVAGAEKYNLYILKPGAAKYTNIAVTTKTTASVSKLKAETKYSFKVAPVDVTNGKSTVGKSSAAVTATTYTKAVTLPITVGVTESDVLGKRFTDSGGTALQFNPADQSKELWVDYAEDVSDYHYIDFAAYTTKVKSKNELEITVPKNESALYFLRDGKTYIYNKADGTLSEDVGQSGYKNVFTAATPENRPAQTNAAEKSLANKIFFLKDGDSNYGANFWTTSSGTSYVRIFGYKDSIDPGKQGTTIKFTAKQNSNGKTEITVPGNGGSLNGSYSFIYNSVNDSLTVAATTVKSGDQPYIPRGTVLKSVADPTNKGKVSEEDLNAQFEASGFRIYVTNGDKKEIWMSGAEDYTETWYDYSYGTYTVQKKSDTELTLTVPKGERTAAYTLVYNKAEGTLTVTSEGGAIAKGTVLPKKISGEYFVGLDKFIG
ncbi:hypothetical protein FACS1894120_5580 [Clostridia bacterium]|nr:hypothetical protein FACS1894120_5580 [Clostridia bacterium]